MQKWSVQDAKARFSELLNTCLENGPQIVTRRGSEAAVLVPIDVWNSVQDFARPSLKDLLLSPDARGEIELPPRGRLKRRPVATWVE